MFKCYDVFTNNLSKILKRRYYIMAKQTKESDESKPLMLSVIKSVTLGMLTTVGYLIMKCYRIQKSNQADIILNDQLLSKTVLIILALLFFSLIAGIYLSFKEKTWQILFNTLAVGGILFLIIFPQCSKIGDVFTITVVAIYCFSRFWYLVLYSPYLDKSSLSKSQILAIFALILPYLSIFLGY